MSVFLRINFICILLHSLCYQCTTYSSSFALSRDFSQVPQYYQTTKFTVPKWVGKYTASKPINPKFQFIPNVLLNNFQEQPMGPSSEIHSTNPMGSASKGEGSFCRRSFDNRSGYCLLAYQCLHVIREYRLHGTKIDICTYRKNIPIICCPLAAKDIEYPNSKRISARKCEDYHRAARGTEFGMMRQFSGKFCVPSIPMIVGGEITHTKEYPHMAALGWSQENEEPTWACAGALISTQYILTAAHCTESAGKPPDIVRLGGHNINNASAETQDIKITIIILHPKYRASKYYHDIALVKLLRPVVFTEQVQPACLWQLPTVDIHRSTAAGWGRTEFMGSKSDVLQKVDLSIIDQKVCRDIYRTERRLPKGITEKQFCAGYMEGGKDTCQGDSGGPLFAEVPEFNCVKFVIGITSFGKFCAAPNAPGVYTKVHAYLDWIEKFVFK